jgi:hypothetical protein
MLRGFNMLIRSQAGSASSYWVIPNFGNLITTLFFK